jgi:hypothetical protein
MMMGIQQAASVATNNVIRKAIADSEACLSRWTALWVFRAAKYIHK